MTIALTAFTRRGAALARRLTDALAPEDCTLALPKALAVSLNLPQSYDSLSQWTAQHFPQADALVFIGAAGIAVRAIAPHVRDKFTDPAVISVDELGQYVIPLLSGHVGGANTLARRLAALTGGTAVISTATDVNGLFAVDQWAAEHNMAITDRALAKEISAALLRGERVGFATDFADDCPPDLHPGRADLGVWITYRAGGGPFPRTLRLIPRRLCLGIGCRRNTPEEAIQAAVAEATAGIDPAAITAAATIDIKRDEEGLLSFCRRRALPLTFYTADQLSAQPGPFTPSPFVKSVTGTDNVCERAAAALSQGPILLPKQAVNAVTIAIAERPPFPTPNS